MPSPDLPGLLGLLAPLAPRVAHVLRETPAASPAAGLGRPALVVLGQRGTGGGAGDAESLAPAESGALARRVAAAAREWKRAHEADPTDERPSVVIASGGRSWAGEVEADVMADALTARGVPRDAIVRERASLDTRDNARFTAAACARRGIGRVVLVTCGFHLARATAHFEREGLEVTRQVSAGDLAGGWASRTWVLGKERFLRALAGVR